jgi:nicotinamidase/pyrazinamidase
LKNGLSSIGRGANLAARLNALILTDIQNDFVPGGALAVNEGGQIVPIVNRMQSHFDLVVATQDWHPPNHGSFAANHYGKKPGDVVDLDGLPQILWPVHCVQNSVGAAFVPALDMKQVAEVFQKGTDPRIDSYSTFYDNGHRKATGLGDYLKARRVTDVFIVGLTTDYCVKFSALDAIRLGFKTHVIEEACRGVNLKEGDAAKAIEEMRKAGVNIVKDVEALRH